MNKKELLFYEAYEAFYAMTKESKAFKNFSIDAFGEDFTGNFGQFRCENMLYMTIISQNS